MKMCMCTWFLVLLKNIMTFFWCAFTCCRTGEGVYEVRGDVAILTFHTGTGSSGFGFTAKITALFYNQKPLFYSANYVFQQPDPFKLKYPNYGQYSANEFSFFVYAPNAEGNTGEIREAFLESYFAEYCADNVASYLFSQSSGDGGHWLFDTRFSSSWLSLSSCN